MNRQERRDQKLSRSNIKDSPDQKAVEAMKHIDVKLPEKSRQDSLAVMMDGVQEARKVAGKLEKRQKKRKMMMTAGGTLTAAILGGLIVINTDAVKEQMPGWFGNEPEQVDEDDLDDRDNDENEEPDDGENDGKDENEETNEDDVDLDVTKPSFEVLEQEGEREIDANNMPVTEEIEFTYEGDSWQETFVPFTSDLIPVQSYRPEDWAVTEETLQGDPDIDQVTIGGHIVLDYYETGATAEDVERNIEDLISTGNIADSEVQELSEDEFPELQSGSEQFDFIETGYRIAAKGKTYMEIYYGELNGRYMTIRSSSTYDEPELWSYGDAFLHFTQEKLPATVYGENETGDEETGRLDNRTIRYQVDDGVAEQQFQLFKDDELGFSTYIPEDFDVEEVKETSVQQYIFKEDDDSDGQMSIGIFDEGVTREDAWSFILNNFAQGENTAREVPDWAIDMYMYGPGTKNTGNVILAEKEGRYFYIEENAEDPETSMLSYGPLKNIVQKFWRFKDDNEWLTFKDDNKRLD